MSIIVERSDFDPHAGYQYYVTFNRNGSFEEEEVKSRLPVEVAVSLCENGDLADFSFELPKSCRSQKSLDLLLQSENARVVEGRVYITMPGLSGDAVALAAGRLELDLAGRIIGMEILWAPIETAM